MRTVTSTPWDHMWRWCVGVAGITVIIVFGAGTAVWFFERGAEDSNLNHWGDALWWAMTTLSTVGYGEHYPVTFVGRFVAVCVMVSGVAVVGAVAAIVSFGFAARLATRLENAVRQVEHQVDQVEAEVEAVEDEMTHRRFGRHQPAGALQELTISLPDTESASSLTWLLARLGWHPLADGAGLGWRQGRIVLRLGVRPWSAPTGVQGRLTFGAGTAERLARVTREAQRHGFHVVAAPRTVRTADGTAMPSPDADRTVLRTAAGFEVALVVS